MAVMRGGEKACTLCIGDFFEGGGEDAFMFVFLLLLLLLLLLLGIICSCVNIFISKKEKRETIKISFSNESNPVTCQIAKLVYYT